MRPSAVAALALVCASAGAAIVLVLGAAFGGLGPERTETVLAQQPPPPPQPAVAPVGSESPPLRPGSFDPAQLYARRSPGVVTVFALFEDHAGGAGGQGSGFVLSKEGILVTNAHVVTIDEDESELVAADEVYVEFSDGDRVEARLVGWDGYADVAVLRVDPRAHALSPVPLGDSSRVVVGEPVAAIGSPFGEEGSLSVGVVSAVNRSIGALVADYRLAGAIQTDAPINRGNSGGPLFDARGRAIGINAQIRSTSGTAEGVAFAIPINAAKRSVREILRSGRVAYAYLGITAEDVTPRLAERLRLPVDAGALVVEVRGSPARSAGLRGASRSLRLAGREHRVGGDVVVDIAGEAIRDSGDLVRVVSEHLRPGQLVSVTVIRSGKRVTVPVRLVERPAD